MYIIRNCTILEPAFEVGRGIILHKMGPSKVRRFSTFWPVYQHKPRCTLKMRSCQQQKYLKRRSIRTAPVQSNLCLCWTVVFKELPELSQTKMHLAMKCSTAHFSDLPVAHFLTAKCGKPFKMYLQLRQSCTRRTSSLEGDKIPVSSALSPLPVSISGLYFVGVIFNPF